jgi:hypothetical protein
MPCRACALRRGEPHGEVVLRFWLVVVRRRSRHSGGHEREPRTRTRPGGVAVGVGHAPLSGRPDTHGPLSQVTRRSAA